MINSKTYLTGLIGNPVEHSLSPEIHNFMFAETKENGIYLAFKVEKENIKKTLEGMKSLGIKGFNVTIPHKEEVLSSLDFISEEVKAIKACNTIFNNDGKLEGYNTDYLGFLKTLEEEGFQIEGKNIAVLGAGGASRAILWALKNNKPSNVDIFNRNLDKAKNLIDEFEIKNSRAFLLTDFKNHSLKYDLIINTTSVGMGELKDQSPIEENVELKKEVILYDLIYNPSKTKFLEIGASSNLKIINGLDMLLYQAILSFQIWTKKEFDIKDMKSKLKLIGKI